ncbi:MAG: hypothetical protein A2289_11145 [Deltaproteobacteria bacterium RIFOXYA12_FULL_58_15]|nr:MAG: hypothetical protein A2289_11145 [Deltaproteobacteria bacterium RIFOXYA12_FULL_58_15]
MLESIRTARQEIAWPGLATALPVLAPDPQRIAVLLNRNARHVTDRVRRRLAHIVGKEHVFETRSIDEAEEFSREVVQRGYGTIVSGGGDGTLMRVVNLVQRYVRESNDWRTERYRRFGETQPLLSQPRFAFLKLGTGNGVSTLIGAGKASRDLQRIVDFVPGRTKSIPLIDMDGERFFFGGMGYDSQLLDDYNSLKAQAKNPIFKMLMQNLTGYFMTVFGRTVPRILSGRAEKMSIRVVNRGRAYFVDSRRGDCVEEIEPGATLWEGPARLVAAGTAPFYGYGFRMFPYARIMPNMMNLRICTLGPLRVLPQLPSMWNGTYRNPKALMDYLVEDVTIEVDKPYPFQHSGDAQGLRDRVDLKIAEDKLELIDMHKPRPTS